MDAEKVIEKKLEKARRAIDIFQLADARTAINQALAVLQAKPKCKTCGEAEVKYPIGMDGKPNHSRNYCYSCGATVKNQKYCHNCGKKLRWPANPACQPKAGELSERIESYLGAAETVGWDSFKAFGGLLQVCKTHIDRLESALKVSDPTDLIKLVGEQELKIDRLESASDYIVQLKEAVKFGWEIAKERASLARESEKRMLKEFRRRFEQILGSATFDKIMEKNEAN